MAVIRQQDFIDSIEESLQFISFYHPLESFIHIDLMQINNKSRFC